MNLIGSKTIETERLILRRTIESDLKTLWEILCMPEVNKLYLATKFELDWEKEKKWQYKKLESANDLDVFQWSIIKKEDNTCIGQISVQKRSSEDETVNDDSIRGIGWYIKPLEQRKGYAFETAEAVLDYMFNEVEITQIDTGAAVDNPASWLLMDKLGFNKRGDEVTKVKYTFVDELVDLYSYGLTRDEYKKNKRR